MKWIRKETGEGMDDIEQFIERFVTCQGDTKEQLEDVRLQFRAGYCWHFAHMLQSTFNRGTVVWAAPFGHICFQDINGNVYDIEGRRDVKGDETYYYIPERYLKDAINDFKHAGTSYGATTKELIEICMNYCMDTGPKSCNHGDDKENNKTIEINLLSAWLDMMIADCDYSIQNHPDIGTVRDGTRMGMKLAYEKVKKEIQNFNWVLKEK